MNPGGEKSMMKDLHSGSDRPRACGSELTASILCMENRMPMLVFGLNEENSIVETMSGTFTGTKVTV